MKNISSNKFGFAEATTHVNLNLLTTLLKFQSRAAYGQTYIDDCMIKRTEASTGKEQAQVVTS